MVNKNMGAVVLVVGIASGMAAPAAAQDTTQAGQPPQRHIVQLGETLWGLAQLYLGDPFLWPEIYRINTSVVEDPHWIFPGEELLLVAADHTQVAVAEQPPVGEAPVQPVVPPTDTAAVEQQAVQRPVEMVELPTALPEAPPPAAETGPTIFARIPITEQVSTVQGGIAETYRGVRPGDFYRAGFLTEGEALPWGTVEGIADLGTARGTVRGVTAATAMIYQEVRLRAPEGAGYQVGDSLLVVRFGRALSGGWGEIVMPTGVVRVVSVAGQDAVAQIVEQFDQVRSGQYAMPIEPFPRSTGGRPQPVSGGIEGLVIARRQLNPIPNLHEVLFIDLGRNVGIVPGDRFEVLTTPDVAADNPAGSPVIAEVQVVHVRERSATVVIQTILTPGIRTAGRNAAGIPVRLVAKMPA
jgi:hypothetical protein